MVDAPHENRSGLILGSATPRRAELLTQLGIEFTVHAIALDEAELVDDSPVAAVAARIARAKYDALSASGQLGAASALRLLTADTLVSCDGSRWGKPRDAAEATKMLASMSGRSVHIASGLCFGLADRRSQPNPEVLSVTTMVRLRGIARAEIDDYVASGEGADKAGALALQGRAGRFVESVAGCWSNVLGLPLCGVLALVERDLADQPDQADRCSVDLCGAVGK